MTEEEVFDVCIKEVKKEYLEAANKFGQFASMHEGAAVVKEEYDEMWDDVKANNPAGVHQEAKQLAAMATRQMVCAISVIHDGEQYDRNTS